MGILRKLQEVKEERKYRKTLRKQKREAETKAYVREKEKAMNGQKVSELRKASVSGRERARERVKQIVTEPSIERRIGAGVLSGTRTITKKVLTGAKEAAKKQKQRYAAKGRYRRMKKRPPPIERTGFAIQTPVTSKQPEFRFLPALPPATKKKRRRDIW